MQLMPLTRGDVDDAARLHLHAFPDFFLSQLGERFVREFYRGFLADGSVTVVARRDTGSLAGVAVGHVRPQGFFARLLLRRWYAFALASLRLVLTRPSQVPRLLRAVTYRGETGDYTPAGALLSSICVDPALRGQAVGSTLLGAWVEQMHEAGATTAYLVTDADDNDGVNGFYLGAGWDLHHSYATPEGRMMNCYVLPPRSAQK